MSFVINQREGKGIPGVYPVYEDSNTLPERYGEKSGGIYAALPESFPLAGRRMVMDYLFKPAVSSSIDTNKL